MAETSTRIEELILLALAGKELYAVQVAHAINQAFGECLYGQNTLYYTLNGLEKKRLISARIEKYQERDEERGGGNRKYYSLTNNGADEVDQLKTLKDKIIKWQPPNNNQLQIMTKLSTKKV